jgi:precorrin-2/cobalt-factor-2 C20-methyltransferase
MKIGRRLPMVLQLLREMGVSRHCVLASRIGLPGERLCEDLAAVPDDTSLGYLSTLLIRRTARERRHP